LSVILPDGTVERPTLGSGDPIDGFAAELEVAVAAVESGTSAPQLSGELARQALRICHAEVESVKSGQPVTIG
jgi:predicted dehydrogenase